MAQKVNIVLVDDIDGNDAEETVRFALDGKEYEIDLNSDNAQELRDALALYIAHGRRASGGRSGGGRGRRSRADSDGPTAAEIREWARESGWDVSDRGRVSAEIREAYADAH